MRIGDIETFPNVEPNKGQVLKVIEEAAEVYSAWEKWRNVSARVGYYQARSYGMCPEFRHLANECADVFMAVSNLLASLDIENFEYVIEECVNRNRERGRYEVQEPNQKKRSSS